MIGYKVFIFIARENCLNFLLLIYTRKTMKRTLQGNKFIGSILKRQNSRFQILWYKFLIRNLR